MMKTLTIRLEDAECIALKNYAASKRMSMTAVIMQQLDALGITKPPESGTATDTPDDLLFTDE